MIEDETKKLKHSLKPGHVIRTMISEHEMILNFLDELEKINYSIQRQDLTDKSRQIAGLKKVAEHLAGTEPHHQREEDVLFPEIKKRGFSCAPEMMEIEHKELREAKKKLLNLSNYSKKVNFNNFKKELNSLVNFIVSMLREHIFKENNILYPVSLDLIKEDIVWEGMKKKCDKIGYCCFTPET